MAKQTINLGTAPTGAGGDTFRSGSAKLQANDDEIYAQLGATAQGVLPAALPVSKGGTGGATATAARTALGLGTAATRNTGTSVGNLMSVGDFGIGAPASVASGSNPNSLIVGAIASTPSEWVGSVIPGISGSNQGLMLNMSSLAGMYCVQLWNPIQSYNPQIRIKNNNVWDTWSKIYCTRNTTVDANGFIKAASPIVKVFADRIELNNEAEQQEIVFEKISIGEYLIKGSSGFAQEGWYIETPKDANGNVLFSVIYKTLENGDISVKTYKKKFDFETVSIVADLDNPVDITENRWIDLRLQELPQPEIEIPEPIAPPDFQPTGLAEAVATVMESYHGPEQ